ncbi:xanthine dehydrogenase family protein molybdopterin-binding subunit [Variovorax sp. JS1663]|uniref:xanthine dehydrogenase family protein molybdopterin-binding subunit n=1 Tax=Variovorax sp. JS1663 TaxID=1851577 RepID=UPI000B3490DD|nr:molybdopterin cofactor-binding domain-containing protein [Variovorax sp. JS1663]OUM02610.1 aldehyde dehydrogenase [Variovorax sp. JS1663]
MAAHENDTPSGAALTRRGFLTVTLGAGGALVAAFHLPAKQALAQGGAREFAPNVYVRIAPSGAVTFVNPFVEMGQGSFTAIPMMLAEEMDVDLSSVTVEQAPADEKRYGNPILGLQVTGASCSIQGAWKAVRGAGATCRAMMVAAAAQAWKVSPGDCRTSRGKVIHTASGRERSYGSLIGPAAALPVPTDVPVKNPKDYKLVGTPAKRTDARAKTDGSARFGIDMRLAGMKVAAIRHCPVLGGKVRKVDDAKALAVRGVRQVVAGDDIVAVIADHYGAARKGLAVLEVEWDEGANATFSTAAWESSVRGALKQKGLVSTNEGDFAALRSGAARVIEAEYGAPTMLHAPLEPMNCTIHARGNACDVWLGTQSPVKVQQAIQRATGIPVENVRVHNFLIGGGFGRRLDAEYVEQAAKIAKQVPFPLKVIYSREEDIRHGSFRPLYCDELAATLDASGTVTGFSHRLAGSAVIARFSPPWIPANGVDPDAVDAAEGPFSIPAKYVEYVPIEPPAGVMTAFWRGVGPGHNGWVIDSFMDEVAVATRADPVAFRAAHLGRNPRAKAVLELAAGKAGWGRSLPPRTGMGVAVLSAWGSHIALVVQLRVAEDGTVEVQRMTSAIDCGVVINPDTVVAQMEGGHIFGLTAAMYGTVTIDKGQVQQSNFHNYQLLRIDQTPAIDVSLVRSGNDPGGVGEIGCAIVIPAYINALHAATGKRFRNYPVPVKELMA